jgi:hypothetical protein
MTRAQSIAARSIQRAWVIASRFSIVRAVALWRAKSAETIVVANATIKSAVTIAAPR